MDSKDLLLVLNRSKTREARIQQALGDLQANRFPNPNAAAVAYDLNPKTLRDRWTGWTQAHQVAHETQMLLTSAEKDTLTAWCIHLSLIGKPLTHESIGATIFEMSGSTPSSAYIDRYLANNKQLLLRRPTGLDPKRALAFNWATIEHHFELLEFAVTSNNIPPENEYNMDEKGIQLGGGKKGTARKFITGRTQIASVKLRSSNLELVTIIECIPAKGAPLPPSFILAGEPGNHQTRWFEEKGVGAVALSESGWTNDELTFLWFKHVFIPAAMA